MKYVVALIVAAATFTAGYVLTEAPRSAQAAPFCNPPCDACHICFQLYTPPGQLRPPPFCAPKDPKPAGCP